MTRFIGVLPKQSPRIRAAGALRYLRVNGLLLRGSAAGATGVGHSIQMLSAKL